MLIRQNDDSWLLDDNQVPHGTYAYVTHLNHLIVVWPCKPDGQDTFHAGLSYFAPEVAYAGTVKFDHGVVVEWNADSGTYKPKPGEKGQAGLPLDKFRLGKGY